MEGPVPARDAARILGVSARHVARLAGRGELTFEETPLGRLYDRAALERRRAQPPRQGRPPKERPLVSLATPPVEQMCVVFMLETLACRFAGGVYSLEGGRPYRLPAPVARWLVGQGHARNLGE